MNKHDDYVAKIRKLLELAERAGTPAEAELAREKAEAMIVKFGIDEAMARNSGADLTADPVTEREYGVETSFDQAEIRLMFAVATGMGLNGFRIGWDSFYVVGHKSDVERFDMLVLSIRQQALIEMNRWWKMNELLHRKKSAYDRKVIRAEFVTSFGLACRNRLEAARKQGEVEVPGSALVLADRSQEVKDFMADKNLGSARRTRARTDAAGRAAGYSAGMSASLGEKALS